MMLLALALLVADFTWRGFQRFWGWFWPLVPEASRVLAIGFLGGGVFVGAIYVSQHIAPLVTEEEITWPQAAFVWGLALLVLSLAAVLYVFVRTSSTMLYTIIARLTDIASRPVVVEQRGSASSASQEPVFRNPGRLGDQVTATRPGDGAFIPYDESRAWMQSQLEDMRNQGVSDETIDQFMREYDAERQTNTSPGES